MRSMKAVISILLVFGIIATVGCSRSTPGTNKKNKTGLASSEIKKVVLDSKLLKKNMNVNVYLPKGYSVSNKYPVLYILHGFYGNEDQWISELELGKTVDAMIDSSRIKPLIIVSPQIDNSFGINSSVEPREYSIGNYNVNEGLYEDYICRELVAYIDSNYSTIASRDGRYIGGVSMGGFAALHAAFTHPDLYSRVGGHSPALFVDDPANAGYPVQLLYPNEEIRRTLDPVYIAGYMDLKGLKVYLDCGDKDEFQFYKGCEKLYGILQSKRVESEYHLNPASHTSSYWKDNAKDYLLFYGS